jgi:hypothetical protein
MGQQGLLRRATHPPELPIDRDFSIRSENGDRKAAGQAQLRNENALFRVALTGVRSPPTMRINLMKRYFWIRLRLFLRQARWGFGLMAAWFLLGTFLFHFAEGLNFRDAVLNAVYLEKSPGNVWELYSFWGQCVLFGIVISIFFLEALQRYNPQEGCRMLAKEIRNHVIVVGYTHLGARIVEHLKQAGSAYVLIDKDPAAVDDLVRGGEPVIVDNAKQSSTLADAGIAHAKTVIVATNNVETALLVTKMAREANPKAHIIVRCYVDDFAEILESLGANEVISSSKSAFEGIAPRLDVASK